MLALNSSSSTRASARRPPNTALVATWAMEGTDTVRKQVKEIATGHEQGGMVVGTLGTS